MSTENTDLMSQAQTATTKNEVVALPTKANLPIKRNNAGEIIDIVETKDGKSFVLTIGLPNGDVRVDFINRAFWLGKDEKGGLDKRFPIGSFVRVSSEDTRENETTYTDSEDNLQFHTKTASRFVGLTKITKGMFDAEMPTNMDDIDLITNSAALGAGEAVANYLGRIRAAQIGGR